MPYLLPAVRPEQPRALRFKRNLALRYCVRAGLLVVGAFCIVSAFLFWQPFISRTKGTYIEHEWALSYLQGRLLGTGSQQDFVAGPLFYFGDSSTAAQLGCPADECGCFFQFAAKGSTARLQDLALGACHVRYTPIRLDKGQPWCLCHVTRPTWLDSKHPAPWRHIKRALVTGQLDSPNPTHQVNVHFFWIWLWLVHIAKLGARQVSLLVDCSQLDACLGRYGQGFARALLSEPVLLQGAAEPLVIDKLKFSVGGNWPFALHEYHQWTMPSPGYADMVSQVRAFYQVQDEGLADPLRVVIAQRPAEQQRSITNAADLAAALQKRSLQVQIVDFGSLSFADQLQAVQGAAALVGVSGSDLINGIFLPLTGVLVEILPANRGHQVINTELFNVMRLAQRSYQRYHSPLDAELRHAADGSLSGNTLLKQMGAVTVDVPGCTAAVEAAALQAAFDQTDRVSWEWAMQSPVNATMYSKHSNMRRAVNRLVRSP